MLQRAYSLIDVKAFDPARRTFAGIATSPVPDRIGDTIAQDGVVYKNPLPLLLYHDSHKPVGEATFKRAAVNGATPFDARISTIDRDSGVVKERLDEAVDSLAAKPPLIRAVSIGFRPLEDPIFNKTTGGYHFPKVEVLELSMVVIPAHQDATIAVAKSLDRSSRAALGGTSITPNKLPGVSGMRKDASMTFSDQIASAKTELQTKSARFQELYEKGENEGGLEPAEASEKDALKDGIGLLTKKISDLQSLESVQALQATPVSYAAPRDVSVNPQQTKSHPRVEMPELPKGTLFTRYAMAVAAGKGSYSDTLEYAKRFTNTPVVAQMVKHFRSKAIEGTSVVGSPAWGGELVNPNTAQTEFVELLMPETIIGKVQGFDRVPFNIPIITQTGGSTFAWVDEGDPKPVGELAFTRDTMGHSKAAGIIVMTEELVRLSTPSAEARARQDMINQCRKFLDEQFIQVAITAGTESPASITNGVASPAATGTDVDALKADLVTAFGTFTANSIPLSGLVIVTSPDLALGISMLTNSLGQAPVGFNVTPVGGTLMGYQVIVSESVDPGTIVIFKPSEIFLADDGEVRIDASNQATLDMSGGTTATFNLWQRNCVGLRAERWINWKKKRANVVAVIDTAAYGPVAGS